MCSGPRTLFAKLEISITAHPDQISSSWKVVNYFKIMVLVKCRREKLHDFFVENVTNVQEGEVKGFGVQQFFLFSFSAFLFLQMQGRFSSKD